MRGRCSVSTNSPPVKSFRGARQKKSDLQRKHEIAVEILMQAIVIAGAVVKEQRGGACVARRMALLQVACVLARIAHINADGLVPAVRDRGKRADKALRVGLLPSRAMDMRNICIPRVQSHAAPLPRGCERAHRMRSSAPAPHTLLASSTAPVVAQPWVSSSIAICVQSSAAMRAPHPAAPVHARALP